MVINKLKKLTFSDFLTAFFCSIIVLILLFNFYLMPEWKSGNIRSYLEGSIFPTLSVASGNFGLFLQGSGGYFRSFWGYLIYGFIVIFFLSTGKLIFNFIFRNQDNESSRVEQLNGPEKIAIIYVLGSLFASLLLLGLGCIGFVNATIGFLLLALGCVLFIIQMDVKRVLRTKLGPFKDLCHRWQMQFTLTEKLLFLLISIFLILSTIRAVPIEMSAGAFVVPYPLASLFAYEGRVFTFPYHLHSYVYMNTQMLTMWAFLLKSEITARLIMWGFQVSLVVLFFGFLKRYTTNFISLCSIVLFIATPLIVTYTVIVKNDFPSNLFLIFSYYCLVNMFNKDFLDEGISKRWAILAGLFCGGAIGHKINAISPVLITTLFIFGYDLYRYYFRKNSFSYLLSFPFLLGLALSSGPWFLRTLIATGNPVYPFFNSLFGSDFVVPWHKLSHEASFYTAEEAISVFISTLSGLHFEESVLTQALFGPGLVFGLLSVFILIRKDFPGEFRLTLLCLWMGFFASAMTRLDSRYQTFFIIFMVCTSFALVLHKILPILKPRWSTLLRCFTLLAILSCFYLNIVQGKFLGMVKLSSIIFFSGFGPGHFSSQSLKSKDDATVDDLIFIHHLINTRTKKDENVLYVELDSLFAFGLERKAFFTSMCDKQIIQDLAERSVDAKELYERLLRFNGVGIHHLILGPRALLKDTWDITHMGISIADKDFEKIRKLINVHADKRIITPDGKLSWYSLKTGNRPPEVVLEQRDAALYPIKVLEYAGVLFRSGKKEDAIRLCRDVLGSHVNPYVKIYTWSALADIYHSMGMESNAVEARSSSARALKEMGR